MGSGSPKNSYSIREGSTGFSGLVNDGIHVVLFLRGAVLQFCFGSKRYVFQVFSVQSVFSLCGHILFFDILYIYILGLLSNINCVTTQTNKQTNKQANKQSQASPILVKTIVDFCCQKNYQPAKNRIDLDFCSLLGGVPPLSILTLKVYLYDKHLKFWSWWLKSVWHAVHLYKRNSPFFLGNDCQTSWMWYRKMALPNMFFVPQTLEDADLSIEKKTAPGAWKNLPKTNSGNVT